MMPPSKSPRFINILRIFFSFSGACKLEKKKAFGTEIVIVQGLMYF
jgi:hypothetical protein